jgi:hypothetical protein
MWDVSGGDLSIDHLLKTVHLPQPSPDPLLTPS